MISGLVTTLKCNPKRIVVAGASNGGTSALFWARNHPELIAAAMAFPGFLEGSAKSLAGKPVFLRWGDLDDKGWKQSMKETVTALKAAGVTLDQAMLPKSGHLVGIPGNELLDWINVNVP